MNRKYENLYKLIVAEFQNHIDTVAPFIKDSKNFENAIHEAIEKRIGQIHNLQIWSELSDIYISLLDENITHKTIGHRKEITHADQVRKHCKDVIIDPARHRGEKKITIRAGDVHSAMGYRNRMPLVCSALGAKKFEAFTHVERIDISGPSNGANAVFTFAMK